MHKLLKSKKGFTLVELMIVVVIMAILVAVAVPIYSAVTANARKKTCLGNQRSIIAQINSTVVGDPGVLKVAATKTAQIIITTNSSGEGVLIKDGSVLGEGAGINDKGVFNEANENDDAGTRFKSLFNDDNFPFCPEANSVLTVSVTNGSSEGQIEIDVSCKNTEHK